MTHNDLVEKARLWLKSINCNIVVSGIQKVNEIPDAIGWKGNFSFLIECKVSRSDFLKDKNKFFRRHEYMGMGRVRIYMCPYGLIKPEEVPEKWGLIWVSRKGMIAKRKKLFKGIYPTKEFIFDQINYLEEISLLLKYCKKLKMHKCKFCKWWQRVPSIRHTSEGKCNHKVFFRKDETFKTAPDFGCELWEGAYDFDKLKIK